MAMVLVKLFRNQRRFLILGFLIALPLCLTIAKASA